MDSLSDYLSNQEGALDDVLDRYETKTQNDYRMKRLALKMKKPGLAQLLGEENPLLSEEFEGLKGKIKLSRENY